MMNVLQNDKNNTYVFFYLRTMYIRTSATLPNDNLG